MPGRIPLRAPGHDGREPVPGWTGEFEWRGFVPGDQLPVGFNPPRGYIVTANNRIVPPDYPYLLGTGYDIGARALRITSLLDAQPRVDLDDLARIQLDQTSPLAQRFVAAWQGVRLRDGDLAALFDEVKRWDGRVSADSRAALLYEGLLLELKRSVFQDALGAEVFRRYLRHSPATALVLLQLSPRPDHPWWRGGRDGTTQSKRRYARRCATWNGGWGRIAAAGGGAACTRWPWSTRWGACPPWPGSSTAPPRPQVGIPSRSTSDPSTRRRPTVRSSSLPCPS